MLSYNNGYYYGYDQIISDVPKLLYYDELYNSGSPMYKKFLNTNLNSIPNNNKKNIGGMNEMPDATLQNKKSASSKENIMSPSISPPIMHNIESKTLNENILDNNSPADISAYLRKLKNQNDILFFILIIFVIILYFQNKYYSSILKFYTKKEDEKKQIQNT